MKKIKGLTYIGVDDLDLDLFEGQYVIPEGVSYNSYILEDEKIAVFDAVDKRKIAQWLKNLDDALGDKTPDYLVVSHVEPDHSAGIMAFAAKYPTAMGKPSRSPSRHSVRMKTPLPCSGPRRDGIILRNGAQPR